jgi:hypothetical protein
MGYNKMKKLFLLLILLLATATLVNATMPTQQYNKIFLSPFYRASLALNTNYTYNVTINPPDRISSVTSAIVAFNVQINGQSQNFTLLVNGQACNNPDYSIATAFSATGTSQVYFDCSNRITKSGIYNITLRSAVNTGTIQGWVDLTYMNNPTGELLLSGTEYSPGDPATIFVQLKDSYGNAITNGACYIDVYYPLTNGSHPYTIVDAPMINTKNVNTLADDGIYYYDLTAPSTLGVYMLSAKCTYSYNWQWVYPVDELIFYPIRQINAGTFTGGGISLNSPIDTLYEKEAGSSVQANYTFNISTYGPISNITTLNLYYAGEGQGANTLTFAYWNGTAFVNLPNTLTFQATAGGSPSGTDQYQTNSIPLIAIRNNDTVIIRLTWSGNNQNMWTDWLSLAVLTSYGTIQDVKGSSEMHITNLANASLSVINAALPASVWNYTNRNLTYYNMTDTTNYTRIDNTILAINTSINTNIDNTRINLTTRINQLEATMIAYFNNISLNVWNYATRTLTAFGFDNTNYTRITTEVWNATNRNLTYYNMTDTTNYSRISNLTALDVWTYTTRNLTYYQNFSTPQVDLTNYTLINQGVWTYITRTLTASPENTTAIANAVWGATTRNLTYYPAQTDMTNYSLIGLYVWNSTTRNLTYYPAQIDLTNYSQITSGVWTYNNRNLTYYPTQIDMTNYSKISNLTATDVWTYANRNLTYYQVNNITASDVWNYINRTLTYYQINNISATDVWTYNNRTLTYYPTQQDLTNYTAIWTYPDRNLTYYPPAYVNTTAVAEDVWNYSSGRYVDGVLI